MKKLNFTYKELIDNLSFTKSDYDKAALDVHEYPTFNGFIQNIMNDCDGTSQDAIWIANTCFELMGKEVYDVCFNDDFSSNNKGWNRTYGYCKNYIKDNNGTNNSYFADYKGGTVSIYNNEREEDVYLEVVK